jgi:hypothetical protein
MSKLNVFEKEAFELNADIFREDNVTVVSIKELGLTIGLRGTHPRLFNHVRVYITQCSEKEQFKFKRGVNELMNKYGNDNYITVPVLGRSITEMLKCIVDMYYGEDLYAVQCRYL